MKSLAKSAAVLIIIALFGINFIYALDVIVATATTAARSRSLAGIAATFVVLSGLSTVAAARGRAVARVSP